MNQINLTKLELLYLISLIKVELAQLEKGYREGSSVYYQREYKDLEELLKKLNQFI